MTVRLPEIRVRGAVGLLLVVVLVAAVHGLTFALATAPFNAGAFAVFPVSAVAAWALQPFLQVIALNMPAFRRSKVRFVLFHATGFAAFLLLAVLLGGIVQVAGARLFGFTLPAPGAVRFEWTVLLGGVDISSLWYVLCVAGWSAYYAARDRNRAALHEAQLQARVVEGRLAELGARLDPHFLFNALNTLTAVMYDDVPATARMLGALERLMIESFQREPTWSLRQERDHTLRFADFVHVRFGSRIRIVWTDVPDLGEVHVPRFAVQTLVENAIKHNQSRRGPLLIEVRVEPDGGRSRISVIDDGAGFLPGADLGGRSLSRLSEMLGLLHSHRAEVRTFAPAGGGARVDIVVPREPAGAVS